MRKKRILFYCQHILGIGHLIRSIEIVRALKGFDVCFLNGGEVIEGFEFPSSVEVVNLPPIKSDAEFSHLRAVDTSEGLDEIKGQRRMRLLSEFERIRPDVLIIELFPFGRKRFASELLPLLARARLAGAATKVVCSLRDILVRKSDQARHEAWVCSLMNRYFDLLLIHADPRLQRLDETFSRVGGLTPEIRYTGYVARSLQARVNHRETNLSPTCAGRVHEPLILVSIGGGRVGHELLVCAVEASASLKDTLPHRMLVCTGPYLPAEQFLRLQGIVEALPHITLKRYTEQFPLLLAKADLSISMAGYNTCMDILTTGVRALVLPFTGGGDEEQLIRAKKLEDHGVVTLIHPDQLYPHLLAEKMRNALSTSPPSLQPIIALDGVENTANLLTELVERRDPSDQSSAAFSNWRSRNGKPATSWQAELRRSLDSLEARRQDIRIFLRADDVDQDEESLRHLLDISLSRAVPLNLEVIPGKLTDTAVALLRSHSRVTPALLEVNQHGWLHFNHEKEGRKCEFGRGRSFHKQLDDISRGKAVLEHAFPVTFYPVFTPPWNRCTPDTLKALDQLDFEVLSRDQDAQPPARYRLREIPITLDLYRWRPGVTLKPSEEIVRELIFQIHGCGTVGILLHHKVMDTAAFSFLDSLFCELTQYSLVRFHTFESLLKSMS